ncbi:hypothetical protein DL766_000019 [Monosporascus sp. MC13-8B]|uniref:C2H2-type domain-containing protein n=1 Tax=Monosporascus cannonballus TaxID=155416 RepID=A0ABY0HJA1_9PEZI|nr:hypothetical protein DL762_000388 [Monosporascus cannonballus]RYP01208.1 hypothetical protein DL763_000333 [Monosporascus cannonballus]RYP40218.1 hypothetical protein DL766_000019 [Monosporascus sp. MC13-8B]
MFKSIRGLESHYRNNSNHRGIPIGPDPTCSLCYETFHDEKKLRVHLNLKHSMVNCPASHECNLVFAMPVEIVNHFDQGGCESMMTLNDAHKHAASRPNDAFTGAAAMEPREWITSLFRDIPQQSSSSRPTGDSATVSTAARPMRSQNFIKSEDSMKLEDEIKREYY